jgi:hypothetical protein
MQSSRPPPSSSVPEGGSAVVRFGTAVGMGAAAALVGVLPATMRVASGEGEAPGAARAWVALAAAALAPMIASVVVLRGARAGLRAFGGPGAELRLYGVGLWLASLLAGLALFGSFLRANTHHHALAGVTFAFGALVFAAGDALVCVRLVSIARGLPDRARRMLLGLLTFAVGIVLFAVGVRFVRAASHDAASYAAAGTVVDVLAFALAAFFAARRFFVARRAVAIIGPPVAIAVAVLGMSALSDPTVRDAVWSRAPAFAEVTDMLSGR